MARYGPKPRPVEDRFWDHVAPGNSRECWEWEGATDRFGYGFLYVQRKPVVWAKAHRLSWEIHNGAIPEGKYVCHRCDNPHCVNPAHLFIGTVRDNNADRHAKGRSRGGRTGNHLDKSGRGNPNAKLSEEDVRAILAVLASGRSHTVTARMFELSEGTVSNIASGKHWAVRGDE